MATSKKTKKKNSLLKTGADADQEVEKVDQEIKARAEKQNEPRRFWLGADEEDVQITFLDGKLKKNGLLDKTSFYEHQVKIGTDWNNYFICIAENEPCPICEDGEFDKKFVSVFTIIDHRSYTDRNDKVWKNQRKLFVCTAGTLKQLQKLATKHGGLAGNMFELSRTGKKKAKVGDIINWEKKIDLAKVEKKLKEEGVAYDYGEVFKEYTAEELGEFGFSTSSIGGEAEVGDDDVDTSDFDTDDASTETDDLEVTDSKAEEADDDDMPF